MILLVASMLATADIGKVSEALGHLLGKQLHDLPLNLEALAKGVSDEAEGKPSPMDEAACLEELAALSAELQRKNAEAFLTENRQKPDVHALADGKVQYVVVHEGSGEPLQSYQSPVIRFEGKSEQVVVLDEVMQGLKLGLTGMRQGEVRRLFIHPDFADPTGPLCTMEVELVRADASGDAEAAYQRENLPEIPSVR